jgi:signal transduction histidine kinase
VVKHAATTSAVLRLAATPAALIVTVLDHGRGFDPTTQPEGMGLKESIRGRIAEAGGTVWIDTAPGAGTYVEITMPLAASPTGTAVVANPNATGGRRSGYRSTGSRARAIAPSYQARRPRHGWHA